MPVHLVKHQMNRTHLDHSFVCSTSGGDLWTALSSLAEWMDKYNMH